uniref:hypothetical protein n=1 Tax=unclassified Variovorax TaxID=663243 RepID=UPI000D450AF5
MPKELPRDAWLDHPREPASAWETSLRPEKSSNRVWFLIGALATALGAYLAYEAWQQDPAHQRNQQGKRQATPPASPTAKPLPTPQTEQPPLAQTPPPQRIHRFTKCTSPTGATTYSDGACPAGTKASEIAVRPDLNLADGMSDEARRASIRDNSAVAQSMAQHERRVAMNVDDPASACAQLNALVASIDAAARQPLPMVRQDQLREERRQARDRQSALHCR